MINHIMYFGLKKQNVFLLRNDDLYSIYIFQIKSGLIWKV